MDAIIGRYRLRMEETMLVVTHPTGISFDLTPDEILGLVDFVNVYRQSLIDMLRDTEPRLKRITIDEDEKEDT